ncbi:MAG: hypothetical protein E3J52_00390 [Promethearchaeota archaeon]|nr:MAG: hypothetical protein E3J52_00390 [Candidatus Lokiarchaeota archaeon]
MLVTNIKYSISFRIWRKGIKNIRNKIREPNIVVSSVDVMEYRKINMKKDTSKKNCSIFKVKFDIVQLI